MSLILVMVSTPLLFSGCNQPEPKTVYVYRDCPKLQKWDVVVAKRKDLKITYIIKEKE